MPIAEGEMQAHVIVATSYICTSLWTWNKPTGIHTFSRSSCVIVSIVGI